jgi:hypothetical protein
MSPDFVTYLPDRSENRYRVIPERALNSDDGQAMLYSLTNQHLIEWITVNSPAHKPNSRKACAPETIGFIPATGRLAWTMTKGSPASTRWR